MLSLCCLTSLLLSEVATGGATPLKVASAGVKLFVLYNQMTGIDVSSAKSVTLPAIRSFCRTPSLRQLVCVLAVYH